jgi:glutaminase/ankyrin repeat protein
MLLNKFAEQVHKHVGREPSGRNFNSRVMLTTAEGSSVDAHGNAVSKGIPHNPCINAGAIMCASLVKPEESEDARFDYVIAQWEKLAGRHRVGFQNGTYMGERASADRNFCLGYMMCEEGAFPENTDLIKTLEAYFMYCSIELTAESMSVVAGSLANNGVCPITGERCFEPQTVKHILTIMQSCGMYDYSGEFAFTVGFPSKSGVSGVLCIVIPGVVGISTFSPRLDHLGNSVRGLDFCKALNKRFPFHQFATLRGCQEAGSKKGQEDITKSAENTANEDDDITHLWFAAASGDVARLRQLAARGVDVTIADYDRRSPLHLAASNGHLAAVRFLVSIGANLEYEDSFQNKAVDDATREGHREVEEELRASTQQPKARALPMPKAQLIEMIESQGIGCSEGAERNMGPVMRELAKLGIGEDVDISSKAFLDQEAEPRTISNAMSGNLVVPNFPQFKAKMQGVFDRVSTATDVKGLVGDGAGMQGENYKDVNPARQALGVCTVDGQRMRCGEEGLRFALDELIRPVLYIQGMSQLGLSEYHERIGREPSPSDATEVELNPHGLPFNPMTTSGAILTSALVDGAMTSREKMKRMKELITRCQGAEPVTENNSLFERLCDNSNKQSCVSYMMKDAGCMDASTNVTENLHAYFRSCSLESTVESLSVFAATLANGGLCPTTGERVFQPFEVKDCLSVMYSAGMDANSGTFQFEVGVPGRFASTGAIMVIVPNVLGAVYYSPPLNPHTGMSLRGMQFCKELISTFAFHQHDRTAVHGVKGLEDPTTYCGNEDHLMVTKMLTAASVGDLMAIKNLHSLGVDLDSSDYDLRTGAHLAAAAGDVPALRYFAEHGADLEAKDRWGGMPIDDARKGKHNKAVSTLSRWINGDDGDDEQAHGSLVRQNSVLEHNIEM